MHLVSAAGHHQECLSLGARTTAVIMLGMFADVFALPDHDMLSKECKILNAYGQLKSECQHRRYVPDEHERCAHVTNDVLDG